METVPKQTPPRAGIAWQIMVLPARAGALAARVPAPLLIAIICFVTYTYKPLLQGSNDNLPLRFGALLLARSGSLDFSSLPAGVTGYYSFTRRPDGSVAAHTPVGTAVTGAIVFFAARVAGMEFIPSNIVFLDWLAASLYCAAAAGMLTWLVRREGRLTAVFLGLAFGLGTATWSCASRMMWQHTGALFWLLTALCLFDSEGRHQRRTIAGTLALAMTVWCRPFMAPGCAVILGARLLRSWLALGLGLAVAVAGSAMWIIYNYMTTGSLLGPYVASAMAFAYRLLDWQTFLGNIAGSLVSPNRGMFVFAPVLLLAVPALIFVAVRRQQHPREVKVAVAALVLVVARGATPLWHGGHCYGSRYMLDVSPLLLLVMAPLTRRLLTGGWLRAAFAWGLLSLSVFIQFLGVSREWVSWNVAMKMTEPANAWNWRRSQIMHCLTYGESTAGPLGEPSLYSLPAGAVLPLKDKFGTPHIRYGFAEYKPWGTWLIPPRSGLAVNLPAPGSIAVQVKAGAPPQPFDPTRIALYWNGRYAGEWPIEQSDPERAESPWIPVPKEFTRPGINRIELRVSRAHYGAAAATEPLGAAIHSIAIRPR